MVNVAIAGGTSPTLGKSITEAILATGRHNVIILTRASSSEQAISTATSQSSPTQQHKYGAPLIPVDYASLPALTSILRHHAVHTLISLLKPLPSTSDANPSLTIHTTLLHACQTAQVSRFILSDWSLAPPSHSHVDLLAHKSELHALGQTHMSTASATGEFMVECSTIQVGGFMEYFVQGCPESESDLQAGLHDDLMLEYIDVANGRVVVPCRSDGGPARVSMTSLPDVGRYVAACLEVPRGQMSGYVGIVGDAFSFDVVVDVLRELGRQTTSVYMTREECIERAKGYQREIEKRVQKGEEFDVRLVMGVMAAQMMACLCGEEEGGGIVRGDNGITLLNEMFPEIKSMKVKELLRRAWGAKTAGNGS